MSEQDDPLIQARLNAIAKHRLPAGMAARLRGQTVEELEADAAAVAHMFGRTEEPRASAEDLFKAQHELKRAQMQRLLGDQPNPWKEES